MFLLRLQNPNKSSASLVRDKFFTTSKIFIFLGIVLVLILSLVPAYDPDMGWHLKNGEYLLAQGGRVPPTDIYSHTMPNFPLIMHEWVTDMGMYLIYHNFGISLLTVIFTLIAALAFLIAALAVPAKREYQIMAALIGCIASLNILGTRPQMITLLFLAILLNLIYYFRRYPASKIIYFLPFLFLIWVNLHGGFAAGLAVLGLFLFFELFKKFIINLLKKFRKQSINLQALTWPNWRKIFYLSVLSGLVTLINPYGWRIYVEIITTITDKYLKYNINEWLPVSFNHPHAFQLFTYLGLLLILTLIAIKKIDYTHLAITIVFGWLAFSSWRNVPLLIIISIPLWVNIVNGLVGESLVRIIKSKLIIVLLLLGVVITGYQLRSKFSTIFSSQSYQAGLAARYPYDAVQYLKQNPIPGKMFNDYNWGGFLIWQYPEEKVFIDGRMPSWRKNGQHTFADYNTISNVQEGYRELLDKYDITWVIVRNNAFLAVALIGDDWKGVYQDGVVAILKRPK